MEGTHGGLRVLLARQPVGDAGDEAGDQVVVVQRVGGAGEPRHVVCVIGMVVTGGARHGVEQASSIVELPGGEER